MLLCGETSNSAILSVMGSNTNGFRDDKCSISCSALNTSGMFIKQLVVARTLRMAWREDGKWFELKFKYDVMGWPDFFRSHPLVKAWSAPLPCCPIAINSQGLFFYEMDY